MEPNLTCYNTETGKELKIYNKLNCATCGFILLTSDIDSETGNYYCRKCKELVLPNLPSGYQLTKPNEEPANVEKELLKALANNTQSYINELCYPYCDAEQKAWGPKMIPEAESWLEDQNVETYFIDRKVSGMLLENASLEAYSKKEELINAILSNDQKFSEKLSIILGISTAKRDKLKGIANDKDLTNQQKIDQMKLIDLNVGIPEENI